MLQIEEVVPKKEADLGLLPGLQRQELQDDSTGQKVLFFALGLIPVVAKREMSDWLSSNHTLLWGAFKISGRNVQIAVYWQRRRCFMCSVIIRMFFTCDNQKRGFMSHIPARIFIFGACFGLWHNFHLKLCSFNIFTFATWFVAFALHVFKHLFKRLCFVLTISSTLHFHIDNF